MHIVPKHELKVDERTHYLVYRKSDNESPWGSRKEMVVGTLSGVFDTFADEVAQDSVILTGVGEVYARNPDKDYNVKVFPLPDIERVYFEQCEFFELDEPSEFAELI